MVANRSGKSLAAALPRVVWLASRVCRSITQSNAAASRLWCNWTRFQRRQQGVAHLGEHYAGGCNLCSARHASHCSGGGCRGTVLCEQRQTRSTSSDASPTKKALITYTPVGRMGGEDRCQCIVLQPPPQRIKAANAGVSDQANP